MGVFFKFILVILCLVSFKIQAANFTGLKLDFRALNQHGTPQAVSELEKRIKTIDSNYFPYVKTLYAERSAEITTEAFVYMQAHTSRVVLAFIPLFIEKEPYIIILVDPFTDKPPLEAAWHKQNLLQKLFDTRAFQKTVKTSSKYFLIPQSDFFTQSFIDLAFSSLEGNKVEHFNEFADGVRTLSVESNASKDFKFEKNNEKNTLRRAEELVEIALNREVHNKNILLNRTHYEVSAYTHINIPMCEQIFKK